MNNSALPEFETVIVEVDGAIARLKMNRPEKGNALDRRMWAEFPQALDWLAKQRHVRAIVISGEGRHFTAGIDLSVVEWLHTLVEDPSRATRSREDILAFIEQCQDAFSAIERNPVPVIAAISGACIGGGVDLISACDLRLCASDAKFSIKEIDLAVVPDVGTIQRLRHVIGYSALAELSYSGETFDAERAKSLGLVSRVCGSRDELMAAADKLAREIASKSPSTTRGIKRHLLWSREHSVRDGLDYVASWNSAMLVGEDLKEAVSAYLQKRTATFED